MATKFKAKAKGYTAGKGRASVELLLPSDVSVTAISGLEALSASGQNGLVTGHCEGDTHDVVADRFSALRYAAEGRAKIPAIPPSGTGCGSSSSAMLSCRAARSGPGCL